MQLGQLSGDMLLQQRLRTTRWWTSISTPTSDWDARQQEGCNISSCINSGHLTTQRKRGCITQRFSATFFRGNQHESINCIDIDIDIQQETINIECREFFDNSFCMENSTYNRDYLANNLEHNMVHYNHNSCFGRSPSTIAQPRSLTTNLTRESGSTMTFEFSSSSTSRSLCPTTPPSCHLAVHSPFQRRGWQRQDGQQQQQQRCTTSVHNNLSSNETWTVSVKTVHRRHRRQASYNKFMITNSSTKSSLTKSYSSSSSRRSGFATKQFATRKVRRVHLQQAHQQERFSSSSSTSSS